MKRLTIAALAAVAMIAGFTANASAEPQAPALRIQPLTPDHGPHHELPKFGYLSELHFNQGYYVKAVYWNTAASHFGLEPGDRLTGAIVNGQYRCLRNGGWNMAISDALYGNGWIKFYVRDVRSGHTVSRWTNVNNWSGQAVVRARAHGS